MKTLVHNETKESRFVFADADAVTLTDSVIYCPGFNIADMNSANATLVENVTPPEDWTGGKYLYDAGAWTLNPNWVDPTQG
jgi:hypothetical protein